MKPTAARNALLISWRAAQRQAERKDAILLNAASFAGYLLAQAGTVVAARALVPLEPIPFYARVLECLADVEREEREEFRSRVAEAITTTLEDVVGAAGKVPA